MGSNDFSDSTFYGLCEIFNKTPSEFIYDMYYEILKDFEYKAVESAVRKVIATHKYNTLPKPADILEFLEGSKDDKAMIAWLQVKEALEKADYYYTVEFSDPIISQCINALSGSWMQFCDDTALKKDMPFVEKRFMDMYRLLLKREIDSPEKLIGFFEAKNRERGFIKSIPKPVQIGHKGEKLQLEKPKKEA